MRVPVRSLPVQAPKDDGPVLGWTRPSEEASRHFDPQPKMSDLPWDLTWGSDPDTRGVDFL